MLTIALAITGIIVYIVIASIVYAVAELQPYASAVNVAGPAIAALWPICVPVTLLCLGASAMVPVWRAIGVSTIQAFNAWRKRRRFPRATARQKGVR